MSDLISQKIDEAIARLKAVSSKATTKDVCFEYTDRMYDEITRVKSEKWSWTDIEKFICAGDEELLKLFNVDRLRSLYKRVSLVRENAKPKVKSQVRKARVSRKPSEHNAVVSREICETSANVLREKSDSIVVVPRETNVSRPSNTRERIRTIVTD